ncbi:hypothetical protein ACFFQW_41085 [Umezawaea endophytica]|uniref:Uncharacterized protein n=1 Tax=Umezawaea endophytica TaxID=1654476 RepID=A0A9X2VYB0_9PSEU|nr:hypothetical protein [Umezawaea endophytica]MCS7484632.1 hypothetical protein [Umezawaea endophytica]
MTATDLRQALLVHTDANRAELALELADRDGGGLVLHGKGKALMAARHLKYAKKFQRGLIVEADAYTGKHRKLAADAFDANWISQQRRLGLSVVLPDGGYVAEGDESGLYSILARVKADGQPDLVAPLALHKSWLDAKAGLPTLLRHVIDAGVPVALTIEHPKDPYATRSLLQGLVEVLQLEVKVYLLRCDVAAVGALCFGAEAAAVGTRTGLRHLFPRKENGGGGAMPSVAALVRGMLSYISLDKIEPEIQQNPDNDLWKCGCVVCGGQSLSWIKSAPKPEDAAYLHSVEVLYQIRAELFDNLATSAERRLAWIGLCDSAIFQHEGTAADWNPQRVLGNWASLRGAQPIS